MNGMLSILIDPQRLGTADTFAREARAYVDWVRASPPAPGFDKVRIAGEPERETRERREREGIPVDIETWTEIRSAAENLNLAPSRIDALARGEG
jgi:uncharacterized oxidoreductase